jgi:ABC-2 type transport system ATP-binding protein
MALTSAPQAPAIDVSGLTKEFKRWDDRANSIKSLLIQWMRFQSGFKGAKTTVVLNGISFRIDAGEFVGIMGPNGAGKSTVLKLMSGIYQPTSGKIHISGQIAPLIELGAGFHPDLSGMENIFLNAAILGFGKKLAEEKLPEILAFAELGDKIYMPVRFYSNGMMARLGFSVATHLPAPILLVDEILAVGDLNFQAKCIQKIQKLHAEGRTIVLVSHDVDAIARHCSRSIILAQGGVHYDGPASNAKAHYLSALNR